MKLKEIRQLRGFSQNTLAKALGVNPSNIMKYESGVNSLDGAKLISLLKICNTLDCRLEDLLSDPETLEQMRIYNERCFKNEG